MASDPTSEHTALLDAIREPAQQLGGRQSLQIARKYRGGSNADGNGRAAGTQPTDAGSTSLRD